MLEPTTPPVRAPAPPRQPTVEWQVAGACNYDCSYCIQSPKYRRGRPEAAQLEAALAFFSTLPGVWEIKCSGGEAFAHPLFLQAVVPGLMDRTPHQISVLTNLSASPAALEAFLDRTAGRLAVFSASLHLEHVDPDAFLDKAAAVATRLSPGARLVVNQVVLPGKLAEAAMCKAKTEARGLRWFPQLFKTKAGVSGYPGEEAALAALIGDAPGPREANLAPSYRGRRCWAGVDYFTVDKDGFAWSCRSAKRHGEGLLGNIFDGGAARWTTPRACPYDRCPCTVPPNRGMVEGLRPSRPSTATAWAEVEG